MVTFKKIVCLVLFLFFFCEVSLFAEGTNDSYRLIWEDNFESAELNTQHWTIEENGDGGGNNEMQYYLKDNISVGKEPQSNESCLIITARKESFGGKPYTSGRLISQGKVTFKYGKIEARIKLPETSNGLWPAFWMMGDDIFSNGWPRCGEIDIMEAGHVNGIKNNVQDRFFNGACHWGAGWQHPVHFAQDTIAPYSIQDGFHLFTMIWDENNISMYLDLDKYPDARPYFQMEIAYNESDKVPGHYFHKPCFILFNMAVGGDFTGIWNIENVTALNEANGFQAFMYVDYVKVYQRGLPGEEYSVLSEPIIDTADNY